MKTLIVYSSKHGTAEKSANILKSKLTGDVDVVNIMLFPPTNLDKYDNIILGGSIYIGKVQKKLIDFITESLSTLLEKRIGLFLCAGEKDETLKTKELISAFPPVLFEHALVKDIFGFEIDINKLNFFEKFIMSKVKGVKTSVYELSEEKIYAFAERLKKTI
ncbi:flavodoxin domain-containing protein [Clostridium lacusfryxellense]|uniref:flavodoxin domain-containing protein n=1 Tax=Clostridium lacusfryxellense TaxID=205328 RepID=UPI001C0B6CE7|nr:flavodoxin domain-containing protein [Clostridium lacusfryxellense]MBU3112473.1 flavodoxin domain-containing protein [Clostridium lacusfryxellense]